MLFIKWYLYIKFLAKNWRVFATISFKNRQNILSGKLDEDKFYLELEDSPFFSIVKHNNLNYESLEYLSIKSGFLEHTKYLRNFFKEANYALKVGGVLEIEYQLTSELYSGGQLIRSYSFLMSEYSLSISQYFQVEDIRMSNTIAVIKFRKKDLVGYSGDVNRWSFGIVSNGSEKSITNIELIIKQIRDFRIPFYEIVVCGPQVMEEHYTNHSDIRFLLDNDIENDNRIPITAKKNKIIDTLIYPNAVIQHDRFFYSPDWYENIISEGGYFEFLCPAIFDYDKKKYRKEDWIGFNGQFLDYKNNFGYPIARKSWNPDLYISGGFMMGKTNIFKKNRMDERLKWGELEDVHYSKKLYLNGYLVKYNDKIINFSRVNQQYQTVGFVKKILTNLRMWS